MFTTLLITFREGLEAFLMVAIATLYLRKTGRFMLIGAVRTGLVVSVAGSVALGLVLAEVGSMSPVWEGLLALLACAAVIWCVVHMLKMGRHMGGEISAGLSKATVLDGSRAWWTVLGFTLFMVGREGVESATMLASLVSNVDAIQLISGGMIGLSLAGAVAMLWVKFGRKVNLSRFFNVTAVFMLAFATLLILKSFFEFTEVNMVPLIDNGYWHEMTASLVEGVPAQIASMLLVIAPTLWLIGAQLMDRSRIRAISA